MPRCFLCPIPQSLFVWVDYPVTLFTQLLWIPLFISLSLILLFLCFGIPREKGCWKYLLLWLLISGPTISFAMSNQWGLCHQVQVTFHTWMPSYLAILSPLKRMISFFLVMTLLAKLLFSPQNRFWLINIWRETMFFFFFFGN